MRSLVPLLLLLQCLVIRIHAFADYLLSGGGCWTDLSPDEVIMNANVVASSEEGATNGSAGKSNLQIEVKGYPVNEHGQVVLASFPQKVQVQVVSSSDRDAALSGDYQFVLEVVDAQGASFSKEGACKGQRQRVSGRRTDIKDLLVEQEGATLIAGWASGHEAVKLTRTVTFVSSSGGGGGGIGKEALVQETEKEQQEEIVRQQKIQVNQQRDPDLDWTEGLVNSCLPNVLLVDKIQEFRVEHSSVVLQATMVGDNQLQIQWLFSDSSNNKPRLVLVSSSSDATFAGGVCSAAEDVPGNSGPRCLVLEQEEIPVLTIHNPHTVRVYAFTFLDDGSVIQRTDPFVLHWVPDKSLQEPAQPEDPQKQVDGQVRADPGLLQQQAQAYQKKDREAMIKPAHHRNEEYRYDDPEEERKKAFYDDAINEHDAQSAESYDIDDEEVEIHRERIEGEIIDRVRDPNHPHRHHLHRHGHLHDNDHPEQAATGGDEEKPRQRHLHHQHHRPYEFHLSDFQVGWSYYTGIAIFLVSPVVVVQLCLRASRRSKGRRSL